MKIFIYLILFCIFTGILPKGLWGGKKEKNNQQQLGNILSLPRFMKYVWNIFFLFKSEQMLVPQTSQCLSLITDWKQLFLKEKHFSSF